MLIMPYPNTALAAWQLAVIAMVAVGALAVWLVAVFLAARPHRRPGQAALSAPGEPAGGAGAGPGRADPADEPEPAAQHRAAA
jgi:hypothetical protein